MAEGGFVPVHELHDATSPTPGQCCRLCGDLVGAEGSSVSCFFWGVPDREIWTCESCAPGLSTLLGFPS